MVVRGETSVPRADLVNLLFAAGATVRVARSMLGAAAVEVTRDRQKVEGADEGWLLDRIWRKDEVAATPAGSAAGAASGLGAGAAS